MYLSVAVSLWATASLATMKLVMMVEYIVFTQYRSSVTVDNSFFDNNVARRYNGGVILAYSSSITVGSSSFDNNEADNDIDGGVMSVDYSCLN